VAAQNAVDVGWIIFIFGLICFGAGCIKKLIHLCSFRITIEEDEQEF
jgi:hypothetical protein